MTINRGLQSATVKGYSVAVDEDERPIAGRLATDDYGQLVPSSSSRTIDIMVRIYSQQNVQDPLYVDVEMIGLTKDRSVAPGEVITLAQGGTYRVKYVIPTGRWQELLLVKL